MKTKIIEQLEDEQLDGWELVRSFLPEGWMQQAKERGAFRRGRGIRDAETLLRVLLIHLSGYSLHETSVRTQESSLGKISAPSLQHRLENSGEWLRWLAQQVRMSMKSGSMVPIEASGMNVRIVDGTSISEPGSTGTDWRIHYSLQLPSLNCDHFEVTSQNQGESFKRFPVEAGDLMIGDRGYSHKKGVRHIVKQGGDVLVRVNWKCFTLLIGQDKRFDPVVQGRGLRVMHPGEWEVTIPGEKEDIPPISGRVIGIKKSRAAAMKARKALRRRCSKKGVKVSKWALTMAGYVYVFTTVPAEKLSAGQVLDIYRARWQIELAFKQLKSILNLGHLPKNNPRAAQAWLHGKLLLALLAQAIIQAGETLSPWGYDIGVQWPQHSKQVS